MPRYPILQGIVGAILGLTITMTLEILLLIVFSDIFHARLTPRGLDWFAIPIVGALVGWRFGRYIGAERIGAAIVGMFNSDDRLARYWLSGSALWVLCALTFYVVFDPYGYYWSSDEWQQFWLVLVAPPALARVGLWLFRWASRAKSRETL